MSGSIPQFLAEHGDIKVGELQQEAGIEHVRRHRAAQDQEYYDHLADTIVALVDRACAGPKTGAAVKVADVGCGRGEVLIRLNRKGYDTLGIDIDPSNIVIGDEQIPVVQGDLLALSEVKAAQGAKVIVLSHVLEHVHSPLTALQECRKLGAEWVVIAVPNLARWTLASKAQLVNRGHQFGWDRHHLRTFLECHAGFEIDTWVTDKVTLPFRRHPLILNNPLFQYMENRFMPSLFPQLATSLVVLCRVGGRSS